MLLLFRPNGIDEGIGWNAARTLMGNPIKMLSLLQNYGDKIGKVTKN